jgi:signal transduction histidine kinase
VARTGRIGIWPERLGAIWVAAALSALAVVFGALSPWALGQHRLATWQTPDAEVFWIPAGKTLLPRYPVEGEAPRRLHQLPIGLSSPVQIFHRFTLSSPVAEPWALMLPAVDGAVRLYVNGMPVTEVAEASGPGWLAEGSRLWIIPQTHLHLGENRVDILVADAPMRAIRSPLYIGPQSSLKPVARWGASVNAAARRLVLALSVLAMAANLAALAARAPGLHLAIAAFFAAAGTRVLIGGAPTEPGQFWPLVDQLLLAAMALCAAAAIRDAATPLTRMQRLREAGLPALAGLLGTGSLLAAAAGLSGAVLAGAATIAVSVLSLVWRLYQAAPAAAGGPLVRQIVAGCAAGLGGVIVGTVVPGAWGLSPPGPPFAADLALSVALVAIAVIAIGVGTIAATRQAYAFLRFRLDQTRIIEQQKKVLDATALALEAKTRQSAVLEERQRMARDVHDGIGGQLASLIAQVRMRRVSMDQVEQALAGGLSELRLLVDSLDLVGETLADALASFLDRALQQTAAAGVRLEWSQTEELAAKITDPKWTLNLYRLMQEAITNALRHSGGDRISVSILSSDGRTLSVRIEDNGVAFDPRAIQSGRGLANMAHRAKELGGTFSIGQATDGSGTVVSVDVPAPG